MNPIKALWVCLTVWSFSWTAFFGFGGLAFGEDPKQPKEIVQQAVQTELAADRDDHSRWLYFEVDRKPKNSVTQWVAETPSGDLDRVLEQNTRSLSIAEQKKKMDDFTQSSTEQERRRKTGKHDESDQATFKLLKLFAQGCLPLDKSRKSGRKDDASLQAECYV